MIQIFKKLLGRPIPAPRTLPEDMFRVPNNQPLRNAIRAGHLCLDRAAAAPAQRFTAVVNSDLLLLIEVGTVQWLTQQERDAVNAAVIRLNSNVAPNQRVTAIRNDHLLILIQMAEASLA